MGDIILNSFDLKHSKFKTNKPIAEKIRPNSLVIIATAGFGLLSVWLWWSRCQKNKPPKKWRKVGTLSELICFPVKSMGPVKTTSLQTSCLGVRSGWMRDRIFMVIDLDKVFITARQHPKMVLVRLVRLSIKPPSKNHS